MLIDQGKTPKASPASMDLLKSNHLGLPRWPNGKEFACQSRRCMFYPWGWEDPLEEEMATPVFLPGESHGQRSLAGYSPWAAKSRTWLKWLSMHTCRFKREGTYVYLRLILADVWQKLNTILWSNYPPIENKYFFKKEKKGGFWFGG